MQRLKPFTAKELVPEGWLRKQLQIQADGLSGNLDLIWPDIKDSKWIGGDREGWERVPYWLDGFIPLAWILNDENKKERAKKYIDAILENQQPDGWICPCRQEERSRYDVWAAFLICKVLTVYHDCTGDARMEDAVYRALKQLMNHILQNTLFNWAAARWYECLIPLLWLYRRRPEKWMLDMATLLEAEGLDYEKLYRAYDFEHPDSRKYWTQINHVVNHAMALKSRALMSYITGENPERFAREMYGKLMRHNSMATGHFTGDECLSGDLPIQGSECCSVAETMFSCEVLLAAGGGCFWGDLLEKEAFNSMPATTTPDMWAHQYVQMTNQISACPIPDDSIPFNSNNGEAAMFGLEPHFGCCTANFNQAWPKYALSVMMESENGVAVLSPVPAKVQLKKEGAAVSVRVDSQYPFRDCADITVETDRPVTFELLIRIPGFAKNAWVDGEKAAPGVFYKITRKWEGTTKIILRMEFETKLEERPNRMKALVRGPLVFSLPVEARVRKLEYCRDGVERKFPYCDYSMTPVSAWNYAFCEEQFEVIYGEVGEMPFDTAHAPVKIRTKLVKIPWEEKGGVCAPEPLERRAEGQPEIMELQPYGCTNLRMTEMPLID